MSNIICRGKHQDNANSQEPGSLTGESQQNMTMLKRPTVNRAKGAIQHPCNSVTANDLPPRNSCGQKSILQLRSKRIPKSGFKPGSRISPLLLKLAIVSSKTF